MTFARLAGAGFLAIAFSAAVTAANLLPGARQQLSGFTPTGGQPQTRKVQNPGVDDILVINPANRHQIVEGFGTYLHQADVQTLEAWKSLGLTIMRMAMPKEVLAVSQDDMATRVPLGSNLATNIGMMNFGIDAVAAYGQSAEWLASKVPNFKLIADCWTPPHWMKGPTGQSSPWVGNPWWDSPEFPTPWLSNTYNHWENTPNHYASQSGDSIGGRLKTEDPTTLNEYGEYFCAWIKGFEQAYHVPIANTSLQNECGFENPFDSMSSQVNTSGLVDQREYAKALKSVRDAFARHAITTPIRGPHFANLARDPELPWGLTSQMNLIDAVKNDADKTLINAMAMYTCNYYMDVDENSVKNVAAYWRGMASVPNTDWCWWTNAPGVMGDHKENWFVETRDGPEQWLNGENGTVGNGAIAVALSLHNALVQADASAYIYWQFVDGQGTPTEYGLLGDGQQADPERCKKFDAFAQFSRYISPGSVRVDANFASTGESAAFGKSQFDTVESLDASAYFNDASGKLTVVLINATALDKTIEVDVPRYLVVSKMQQIRTSAVENVVDVGDAIMPGGKGNVCVPAYSVVTLSGSSKMTGPVRGSGTTATAQ